MAFAAKAVADSNSSTAVAAAYAAVASAIIDEAEKRHGERSPEWAQIVATLGNVTDASTLLRGLPPVGRSDAVNDLLRQFARRLAVQLQDLIPAGQLAATDTILAALLEIRLDIRQMAVRGSEAGLNALAIELDTDGSWRRLKVHNPNAVAAHGCSVQLVQYASATALPPQVMLPSRGFRFGWTTHGRDTPTRYADIPPGAHDYADLHQIVPERGYFTHVGPGASPHTYMPFWGLPAGTYTYELAVGSSGNERIPTTAVVIGATYDGSARLDLELRNMPSS